MAWRVELDPAVERELSRIDPQTVRRTLTFQHGGVAQLDDPRSIGDALKGSRLGKFRKCCVGTTGSSPASRTVPCASWS